MQPHTRSILAFLQYAPDEEQFRRVLQGGYSYITFKYVVLPTVATKYTNREGYTPVHISRTQYSAFAGEAWGFRFLESSDLWLWPDTPIVIVGDVSQIEAVLHHPSLRNTIHVLYLAQVTHKNPTLNTSLGNEIHEKGQPEDFKGHQFKIVALHEFPLSAFRRDSETHGTTLTPLDSLDDRMLKAIAARANFTYVVREPWDRMWGVELENGNWTGTVGTLQHQQADFSMLLTVAPTRLRVIHFSIIYTKDTIILISLKPTLLPQSLAIIRPFTAPGPHPLTVGDIGETGRPHFDPKDATNRLCLCIRTAWSWRSDEQEVSMNSALFYSWGALMENWTPKPPVNVTGRLLVGLWLMACVILTTAYRSSLVAHLVVQDKNPEINTFQDLLNRDGWGWGTGRTGDAFHIYFASSPDPTIQKTFKQMQLAPDDEQFRRVLQGGYSFITFKYSALTKVAATYTNRQGYTPLHISRTEYPPFAGEGRGAPFRRRISDMMQHIVEGGFINYWLDDIIAYYIRTKTKKAGGGERKEEDEEIVEASESQRALGLNHLQGAFYLALLGCGVAFLSLMVENLACYCSKAHQPHVM
ncbi:glutamate receptor ionotropic, delta-1-like [Panulirus ornatus]|uniref:glutamate receptor ionotropic, delta-1-like n=1 Tax=Panulirus ornatus TaxID=150431 RepID=UPI003A880485